MRPGSSYHVKEAQPPIGILLKLLYIGMVQGVVETFWHMVLVLFKVDDLPGKIFLDYLTHLKVADAASSWSLSLVMDFPPKYLELAFSGAR